MSAHKIAIAWLAVVASTASAQAPLPQERVMNVTHGPETVFAEPVDAIMPSLTGARATGENGRLGLELVFWGYEQASGRRVFLYACASDPSVDCAGRVPGICLNGTTLLEQGQTNGTIVRRQCRTVAATAPGDRRPGCADRTESVPVAVGLVACG
jgi:hypothetical protein